MKHNASQTVTDFIMGFVENDAEKIASTLAPHLAILGGCIPNLEAHMFLTGPPLQEWIHGMLEEAGPHQNDFTVARTSERMGATLIVTNETGRNRFREWQDQVVTYILGDFDGKPLIVAYCMSDS